MNAAMRTVLNEPGVPGAPRRVWRDWVLVAGGSGSSIIEAAVRRDVPLRWPTLVLGIGMIALLPLRRTKPLAIVVACFGGMLALSTAQLVFDLDGTSGYGGMAVLITSLYAVVRWGSGRDAVIGGVLSLATSTVAIIADWTTLSDAIGGYAVLVVVFASALAVRFRGAARRRERDQIRSAERERLARDLHDTVAHHVSAIAIRAQAGIAVAPTTPDAAVDALRVIRAEATQTLAEMRAMVGVLRRDGAAELAPAPQLADLRTLADHSADVPTVEVNIDDRIGDVSPAVAAALYRIAQESVTNARRHARQATRVTVEAHAAGNHVELRIADDGLAVSHRRGDGYGLIGMSERANLLGGSCTAGPGPLRGWSVVARLPREGVAT